MDFNSLSATRVEAKAYLCDDSDIELREFQGKQRKHKGNQQATKEVFDALFSTIEGNVSELSENLIEANVTFGELASLTDKDLELIGCKDKNQRKSLLEFFKLMPKQERSYTQIMQSEEAQYYNETILKRASSHLDAMRSALAAAGYKLKVIPPKDVVVDEKYYASRFVLSTLEEMQRVTDEIESELNELEKATIDFEKQKKSRRPIVKRLTFFVSSALITSLAFFVWKSIRSK